VSPDPSCPRLIMLRSDIFIALRPSMEPRARPGIPALAGLQLL